MLLALFLAALDALEVEEDADDLPSGNLDAIVVDKFCFDWGAIGEDCGSAGIDSVAPDCTDEADSTRDLVRLPPLKQRQGEEAGPASQETSPS